MSKLLLTLLTLTVGIGMSTQAAVNGALGRRVGTVEGAFISFFIGTVSLFLLLIFFGKGSIMEVFTVPNGSFLAVCSGLLISPLRLGVAPTKREKCTLRDYVYSLL